MNFERRPLFLEVTGHEEYIEIDQKYGPSGEIASLERIEGTGTTFLHLRLPDGTIVRAQVSPEQLDSILTLMYPDFNGEVDVGACFQMG